MEYAIDNYLEREVRGSDAAKYGENSRYRYVCPVCDEYVFLAAVEGLNQTPHFRHYRNNSGVDCENYTGINQSEALVKPNIHNKFFKRVEFYFDYVNNQFLIGIAFSERNIQFYNEAGASIILTAEGIDNFLLEYSISRTNFFPDSLTFFRLQFFSFTYFLQNTLSQIKLEFPLFKDPNCNQPTVFRKLLSESNRSKMVDEKDTLFTGVDYFLIMPDRALALPPDISSDDNIIIGASMPIKTLGKTFYVRLLKIKNITDNIERLISSWGYKLKPSEKITILWPPLVEKDDVFHFIKDYIFLTSSFDLESMGNTNVTRTQIETISSEITTITASNSEKVKIYYRNTELNLINRYLEMQSADFENIAVETVKVFTVPSNTTSIFLHFGDFGVQKLPQGMDVFLTHNSYINEYKNNYLIRRIQLPEQRQSSEEAVLKDILTHYKKVEEYSLEELQYLGKTDVIKHYLGSCKKTGLINSFVKQKLLVGEL